MLSWACLEMILELNFLNFWFHDILQQQKDIFDRPLKVFKNLTQKFHWLLSSTGFWEGVSFTIVKFVSSLVSYFVLQLRNFELRPRNFAPEISRKKPFVLPFSFLHYVYNAFQKLCSLKWFLFFVSVFILLHSGVMIIYNDNYPNENQQIFLLWL